LVNHELSESPEPVLEEKKNAKTTCPREIVGDNGINQGGRRKKRTEKRSELEGLREAERKGWNVRSEARLGFP